MFIPPLTARVEELGDLARLRVNSRQIGALVQVAIDAGKSKIADFVGAAVLSGDDVLDVESRQR